WPLLACAARCAVPGCSPASSHRPPSMASKGAIGRMAASTGGYQYAGHLGDLLQGPAPGDGTAARLYIVSLGRFAVFIAGEQISNARWGRPKVQKLFKYLLTARNHSAHRDVLMEALWPELPVDAAWSNQKNGVYRLRRVL